MTQFMVLHLVLAGVGVGVVCLVAFSVRALAWRDAVLRYQLMIASLVAAFLLLALQAITAVMMPTAPAIDAVPDLVAESGASVVSPESASIVQQTRGQASLRVETPLMALPMPRAFVFSVTSVVSGWASTLLVLYAMGVAIVLACLAIRAAANVRLLRTARSMTDARILGLWSTLLRDERRGPRLLESNGLHAPACCDLGRPVVILPAHAALLDDQTLLAVLRHELIHVRRYDGMVAIAATGLAALLWFQPLVWVFARVLKADREHSCDALVVRATRKPRSYALALLRFCGQEGPFTRVTSLVGFESERSIRRRFTMLAHALRPAAFARRVVASGVAVASFACVGVAHAVLIGAANPGAVLSTAPAAGVASVAELAAPRMTAEVVARAEGRSDAEVFERLVKLGVITREDGEAEVLPFRQVYVAIPQGDGVQFPRATIADSAAVVAAEQAAFEGNTLRSDQVRLSLPDGSKLRAVFEGDSVAMEPGPSGVARVVVIGGTVRIVDDRGFTRAQARAESLRPDAKLTLTSKAEEGAQSFELVASEGPNVVPVRVDVSTAVPPRTSDSVHRSVGWQLIAPAPVLAPQAAPATGAGALRIQWTYEIRELAGSVGC